MSFHEICEALFASQSERFRWFWVSAILAEGIVPRNVHDIQHQKHQHNSPLVPRRIAGVEDGFNCSTSNASPDLPGHCFETYLFDKALKLPRHQQASSIRSLETSCTKCIRWRCSARCSSSCCLPCKWETINSSPSSS